MDGGDLQKHRASSLKVEVKLNAARNRERFQDHNRASLSIPERGFSMITDVAVDQNRLPDAQQRDNITPPLNMAKSKLEDEKKRETTLIATLPWSHQQNHRFDTLDQASASQLSFIMKFLDFVFPALFPYYKPDIFDSGRSWLLLLLRKSKIAYHATLGLSCYYFTLTLSDIEEGTEHRICKQLQWNEVETETARCFGSLRADIAAMNLDIRSVSITVKDKVDLMNAILQVIVFEMTMGKSAPWNTHLPAAITILEEIMAADEAQVQYQGQSQSKFASVLLGIEEPLWTNPGPSNHIWSPLQTGFRFGTGLLIFIDIIASTILRIEPRLLHLHTDVLSKIDDGLFIVGEPEIRLSTIVGCRNSIARSVAETSSIASLDQEVPPRESVAVMTRANEVALAHRDCIHDLQQDLDASGAPSPSSLPALVWSLASNLYHVTLTQGWYLANSAIRADVSRMVTLLDEFPSGQLRTVAWPICVAGCLAEKHEEQFFAALFSRLGRAEIAGALSDVRELVERAWERRSSLEDSGLDFSSGLATLTTPILLL